MPTFDEVLPRCQANLFDEGQWGGAVNLCTRLPIDTFLTMKANLSHWRKHTHAIFARYIDRCIESAIIPMGDRIVVEMDGEWVQGIDEYLTAVRAEKKFTGNHQMYRNKEESAAETKRLNDTHGNFGRSRFDDFPNQGMPWNHRITPRQQAMLGRHLWRWIFPANPDRVMMEGLPYVKLNQKQVRRMTKLMGQAPMIDIVYGFYNERKYFNWWEGCRLLVRCLQTPTCTERFATFVARIIHDAAGFADKIKPEWKTSTVKAILDTIFFTEEFGSMPILADALEDAGCDHERLLAHLRDPASEFTLASWIFQQFGRTA